MVSLLFIFNHFFSLLLSWRFFYILNHSFNKITFFWLVILFGWSIRIWSGSTFPYILSARCKYFFFCLFIFIIAYCNSYCPRWLYQLETTTWCVCDFQSMRKTCVYCTWCFAAARIVAIANRFCFTKVCFWLYICCCCCVGVCISISCTCTMYVCFNCFPTLHRTLPPSAVKSTVYTR